MPDYHGPLWRPVIGLDKFSALAPVLGPWLCHPHPLQLFMAVSMIPNNMWHSSCCIACGILISWLTKFATLMLEPARVIQYVLMYNMLVSWDTQLNYTWSIQQTWIIWQHEASKTKKKRHVIEHTWNMVNCVTCPRWLGRLSSCLLIKSISRVQFSSSA